MPSPLLHPRPHQGRSILRRLLLLAALLAGALGTAPRVILAQADTVFSSTQLDEVPRLASPSAASQQLAQSYPAAMKRLGVTGMVQVQFVVDAEGKVEAESVQVMSASAPQLAAAAKGVVKVIKFRPGLIDGRPVRALVLLPIVYK